VGNAEGQKSFVEDVLALQTKLETMLRQAFFMQVRRLLLCGMLATVHPVFCSVLALCLLWVGGCGLCGLRRYLTRAVAYVLRWMLRIGLSASI
jgi:hypothetical protein